MPWRPGDTVAWRVRVRIDIDRPDGEVGMVMPAIVVHDAADQVVAYQAPGSIMKRHNGESGGPGGRVVLGQRAGYQDVVWHRWRRLFLRRPQDEHMVSLFWDSETDALRFWYIDLVTPLRRTAVGFEWVDHGIDVIVEPDMRSWSWKDAEELDWYVEHGRYTRSDADRIRTEADAAIARLRRERDHFERWLDWRPDPSWEIPTLPAGWDAE
jgi:hypothetical protein